MSDIEKKPSLRISPNVYGRTELKNRVRYLIDPKGEGTETGAEDLPALSLNLQNGPPTWLISSRAAKHHPWFCLA